MEWSQGFLLAIKYAGLHRNYKVVTVEAFIQPISQHAEFKQHEFPLVGPPLQIKMGETVESATEIRRCRETHWATRIPWCFKLTALQWVLIRSKSSSWKETTKELETKTMYNQRRRWNPFCLRKNISYIDSFLETTLYTTLLKPEAIFWTFDTHKLLVFPPRPWDQNSSWRCLKLINHAALVCFSLIFFRIQGRIWIQHPPNELFVCQDTQLMSKAHAAWAVCSIVSWSNTNCFRHGHPQFGVHLLQI